MKVLLILDKSIVLNDVRPLIIALTGFMPPLAALLNPSNLDAAFLAALATVRKPLPSLDTAPVNTWIAPLLTARLW